MRIKFIKIIAVFLALLQIAFILSACGKSDYEGFEKADGTLDEVVEEIESKGLVAAVVAVYEDDQEDGTVFVSTDYNDGVSVGGCVTVAVNDLSFKEKVFAMPLAPRYFYQDDYNVLQDKLESDEDKKTMGIYYNLVDNMVFLEPTCSAKQREAIAEIIEKTGYTHENMLADYVEMGFIPTLGSNIIAQVIDKSNCKFEEIDGTISITSVSVKSSNIVIPDEIDSNPVTNLNLENSYSAFNLIHALTFGKNLSMVDSAGSCAFSLYNINPNGAKPLISEFFAGDSDYRVENEDGITVLDTVIFRYEGEEGSYTVPESINYIAAGAFSNSHITEVKLHNDVLSIGRSAFRGTGITSVVIPEKIELIGEETFYECEKLESVVIPKSVKKIEYNAFCGVSSPAVYADSIESWCNIHFEGRFSNPLANGPLYVDDKLVTDVVVPDGIKEISNYAFKYYKYIESVEIPDSVTRIGYDAFSGCENLSKISGGDNVVIVNGDAFGGTPWITNEMNSSRDDFVMFGDGVLLVYVGTDKEVVLPDTVKYMNSYAFFEASTVRSLTINSNIAYDERGFEAYFSNNLEKLVIPESIDDIDNLGVAYHQEADEEAGKLYVEGTTVYCAPGSAAEEYCIDRSIPYEHIG